MIWRPPNHRALNPVKKIHPNSIDAGKRNMAIGRLAGIRQSLNTLIREYIPYGDPLQSNLEASVDLIEFQVKRAINEGRLKKKERNT